MITEDKILNVGKFQKTHALKGELNALLDIDADYLEEGNPMIVDMEGAFVPFYTDSLRTKGAESYLIKLAGVDSAEEARIFVNKDIYVERKPYADFMGLDEDELILDTDLIGYTMIDDNFGILGTVADIDDATENVLFIVETPDGGELMIPAADDFINAIDEDKKTIEVEIPEQLLNLNRKEEDE